MARVSKKTISLCIDKLVLILFLYTIFLSTISLSSALMQNTKLRGMIYSFENLMLYITVGLTLIKHILNRQKISILFLISMLVAVINFIIVENNSLLMLLLQCFIVKDYEFKNVLKQILNIILFAFTIICLFDLFNIAPDIQVGRADGSIRHSLGFWHPNSAATFFMAIVLIKLYLNNFMPSCIDLLLITISTICIYILTDSRASTIIIIFAVMISILTRLFNKKFRFRLQFLQNKYVKAILVSIPFLLLLGSIICSVLFNHDNVFFSAIDKVLSGRFNYSNLALQEIQISLFSTVIPSGGEIILDNCFINFTFTLGIIGTLTILGLYALSIKQIIKNEDYALLFIIMLYLCFGMVEAMLIYYKMNIFAFSIIYAFNKNSKPNKGMIQYERFINNYTYI